MPLIRSASKKAFSQNVSTEMHAGKPQTQALAIAFSEQRAAMKKKKKTRKRKTIAVNKDGGRKMIRITSNPYSAY